MTQIHTASRWPFYCCIHSWHEHIARMWTAALSSLTSSFLGRARVDGSVSASLAQPLREVTWAWSEARLPKTCVRVCVGSTGAVWTWSREAKQQTHPEFKQILKWEKKQRVCVVCLIHVCFHPLRQKTSVFSTTMNCLSSISDSGTMPYTDTSRAVVVL